MPKQNQRSSSLELARQSLLKNGASWPFPSSSKGSAYATNTTSRHDGSDSDDEFVVDIGFEETMQLLSKSGAGNATVDGEPITAWLTSHIKFPNQESKVQTSYVLAACIGAEAFAKDPLVLCCRQQDYDDGLATAVVVREYDPVLESRWWFKVMDHIRFKATIVRLMLAGRVPDVLKSSQYKQEQKRFEAKADALEAVVPSWHLQHGPFRKHWYVAMVGTDPAYQGRGHGSKTMLRLGALADERRMECYLECSSEKNRRFYEKCGYSVVAQKTLEDPTSAGAGVSGRDDGGVGKPLTIFLMVRPPKTSQ